MNRLAYNQYRGWVLPYDEEGTDKGYLVEQMNSGGTNHPDHGDYVSWLPEEIFEQSYVPTTGMSFSYALEALKLGNKIARTGWNGKDMFLFLVAGSTFAVNRPPLLGIYEEGTVIDYHAHIDMRTANGQIVPWLASQTDMLADDWVILN